MNPAFICLSQGDFTGGMRCNIAPVLEQLAEQDAARFTDLEEQLDDYVRLISSVKVCIILLYSLLLCNKSSCVREMFAL